LRNSFLSFFNEYYLKEKILFNFDLIHSFYIYRTESNFYEELLSYYSEKDNLKEYIIDKEILDSYYLVFLTSYVNFLRRHAKLKEAGIYVSKIIGEWEGGESENIKHTDVDKQLSTLYYELGYIYYLSGEFSSAGLAFQKSVFYAQKGGNEVSEWFTKCVMDRISFIGGTKSADEFEKTLEDAFNIFKKYESENHAAKRWLMVTIIHRFEIAFARKDKIKLNEYYNFLLVNEWMKEFQVSMDLYDAQKSLAEEDYKAAIINYEHYIAAYSEEVLHTMEAIIEVYRDLGLAYFKNGDREKAREVWESGLKFSDEPGNHVPKRNIREYINDLF